VDWALANTVTGFRELKKSRILESIVYWHLLRMGLQTTYTIVGTDKHEVDFIAGYPNKEPHLAIQVCPDISDPEVLLRKKRIFHSLKKYYKNIKPVILTVKEHSARIECEYPIIKTWKWILENT